MKIKLSRSDPDFYNIENILIYKLDFNTGYFEYDASTIKKYYKYIFKINITEDNLNYLKAIFDEDNVSLNIDSELYIRTYTISLCTKGIKFSLIRNEYRFFTDFLYSESNKERMFNEAQKIYDKILMISKVEFINEN